MVSNIILDERTIRIGRTIGNCALFVASTGKVSINLATKKVQEKEPAGFLKWGIRDCLNMVLWDCD